MEAVYRLGRASAREVLEELPDSPSYSTVRTMLRHLEGKGRLSHEQEGPRYVYFPTVPRERAQRSSLRRVVEGLFDGSVERAVTAMLELPPGALSEEELARIAARIEEMREAGR